MRTLHPVLAGLTLVKGTRHLGQRRLELDGGGVVGDRQLCFVDVQRGRVLRTVRHPELIALTAELSTDGMLRVTLPEDVVTAPLQPSGERLTCDYWGRRVPLELLESPHAGAVSAYLGRPVRLARAPRSAIVYAGPGLTLIGTATLAELGRLLGRPVDPMRFRTSLVVATEVPFEEETWAGQAVRVGSATLVMGEPVSRCTVIDRDPVTGAKNEALLALLARHRPRSTTGEPVAAVHAQVDRPGAVEIADRPAQCVEGSVSTSCRSSDQSV